MFLRAVILVMLFVLNGLIKVSLAHSYENNVSNHSDKNNNLCTEKLYSENCYNVKNIKTTLNGFVLSGLSDLPTSKKKNNFYGQAFISLDVNTITKSGLEYGGLIEIVAQKRSMINFKEEAALNCVKLLGNCSNESSSTQSNFGHEAQFNYNRDNLNNQIQTSLEAASFYLRSQYGDFFIGSDVGAAYLFSMGKPDIYSLGASGSAIDYTGLNSVRTKNNITGKAKKIIYTSPRLFGDKIGFGLEYGISYAPNFNACGIEYCVKKRIEEVEIKDRVNLKDAIELGVAIDKIYNNGLMFEIAMSYAHAKNINVAGDFNNLNAWNFGYKVIYNKFTLSSSYLKSNNALKYGDYIAWDGGAIWKPGRLGVSMSYGKSLERNIYRKTSYSLAGLSYEFNDYILSAGLQYIKRKQTNLNELHINKLTKPFIHIKYEF